MVDLNYQNLFDAIYLFFKFIAHFYLVAMVPLTLTMSFVSHCIQRASQQIPTVSDSVVKPFAEDISSRLLIFNTSLHLHQIALTPELPPPSHSLFLPVCLCFLLASLARSHPAPPSHALIVSIRYPGEHIDMCFDFILPCAPHTAGCRGQTNK